MKTNITAASLRETCDMVEANINPILARCEVAAEAGEEFIIYNDTLTTKQRTALTDRGLVVEGDDEIVEITYKIKW